MRRFYRTGEAEPAGARGNRGDPARPSPAGASEFDEALLARLLSAHWSQELAPPAVVALVAGALWAEDTWLRATLWFVTMFTTSLLRMLARRRLLAAVSVPARERMASIRRHIALAGFSWAIGPPLLTGVQPFDMMALQGMVFAGAIAVGTPTLAGDKRSFAWFAGPMLVSLVYGFAPFVPDRPALIALSLVAIFALTSAAGYRAHHRRLIDLLRTTHDLEEIRGRTLIERIVPERDLQAADEADSRAAQGEIAGVEVVLRHRERAEEALREEEAQYRLLVESASDLVWQVDRELRWTFLNGAAQSIYGLPAAALLGTPFLDRVDPERRESDREMLLRLLTGYEVHDHETVHVDENGERATLSFSARPLHGETGAIMGAQGTARDVSARVAARLALERGRAEAERIAQAKSAFLAHMSHEIRTPMNGIMGMTELLLMTSLTPDQRRQAEVIRNSAASLLRIINDVLDFSKLEAGRVTLDQAPFELHGLVDSVVRPLALQAFRRGIEMVCDIDDGAPRWVIGDAGRLRQVLTNLVGNAVKFTHDGEIEVRVTAQGSEEAPQIRFTVRDTGIGIAQHQIESIFEEFTQAGHTTTRRHEGTGLGLTISRHLVRLMGGELTVASEEGRGSEFGFVLSLRPVAAVAAGTVRDDAVLSERRILVVDDSAAALAYHSRALAGVVRTVETADTADAAFGRLRAASAMGAPFDIVVLDAGLRGRDGFQMADDIARDPVIPNPRLLLLAGVGVPGDGERCREHGIAGYMTKPVARDELIEAVHTVVADGWSPDFLNEPFVTRHSITESRMPLRVLLAEDDPVNREVALKMLKQRGHTVLAVENGREAVRAALAAPFDVVLMDVQMPIMDGIVATHEIRRHTRLQGLHIVAVTAHAFAEERDRCLAAGMNEHLPKPFTPAELFAAVEKADAGRPGSAGPAPAPPIDYEGFSAMMREVGAEDSVVPVLHVFMDDMSRRIQELERAIARNDADTVGTLAHGGKSAAGTVRAGALADALAALEAAARESDVSRLPALLSEVRSVFGEITRILGRNGIRGAET